MDFKAGDKVVCISSELSGRNLEVGKIYTVSPRETPYFDQIMIEEIIHFGFLKNRFQLAEEYFKEKYTVGKWISGSPDPHLFEIARIHTFHENGGSRFSDHPPSDSPIVAWKILEWKKKKVKKTVTIYTVWNTDTGAIFISTVHKEKAKEYLSHVKVLFESTHEYEVEE
jgi:hypothetical protein